MAPEDLYGDPEESRELDRNDELLGRLETTADRFLGQVVNTQF